MINLNENNPSYHLSISIKAAEEDRESRDFYSFKNNNEAISFLDDKK